MDSPVDLGRFGTLIGMGAGTYEVYVDVAVLAPGQTSVTAKLHGWLVSGSAGNALLAPRTQQARSGRDAPILAAWFGLLRDQRHLALITFTNGTAPVGFTTLRVDT